jgi:hypothetical protein
MRMLAVALALLLVGCATPEQIAARQAYEAQAQEERNIAYTRHLANQCRVVGYQDGSEGFRQCILTLHSQAQAELSQMRGIAAQEALRRQGQQVPYCSSLPPGTAGYARAQGSCR